MSITSAKSKSYSEGALAVNLCWCVQGEYKPGPGQPPLRLDAGRCPVPSGVEHLAYALAADDMRRLIATDSGISWSPLGTVAFTRDSDNIVHAVVDLQLLGSEQALTAALSSDMLRARKRELRTAFAALRVPSPPAFATVHVSFEHTVDGLALVTQA